VTRLAGGSAIVPVLAACMLAAGCAGTAHSPRASTPAAAPAEPLDTSVSAVAGTWATVVMGGSAAQYNNFWQVLIRPAGDARWRLVTPPGTADNGGVVLAPGDGRSAVAAVRPSQYLTYTPLARTRDVGTEWAALSPLDARLARTPGSLAVLPGGSRLLALTSIGTAEQSGRSSGTWTTLATARALAATPAGQRCGLRAVSAVAYAPSGVPLLAGQCAHSGTAGIFADIGGTWRMAGPAMPASLAGQDIAVLRLAEAGGRVSALLQAGSGHALSLLAAWSATGTSAWTISAQLRLRNAALASASFGPAGTVAVSTASGSGATITDGGSWRALPALPRGTAVLAPRAGGLVDALAARGSTLTVWELPAGGTAWARAQVISVPIQYGSSG